MAKKEFVRKAINIRIEELRKAKDLTQEQFAVALGMEKERGRSTVNNWEQGIVQVKSDDIALIASTFNVSADYLLGLSNNMTSDKDLDFVCKYTGLTVEAVEAIRESFQTPRINPAQQKQKRAIANAFFAAAWKTFINKLSEIELKIYFIKQAQNINKESALYQYRLLPVFEYEQFSRKIPQLLFDTSALEEE